MSNAKPGPVKSVVLENTAASHRGIHLGKEGRDFIGLDGTAQPKGKTTETLTGTRAAEVLKRRDELEGIGLRVQAA